MATAPQDLKALCRLIHQADSILGTIPDPHPSIPSSREKLSAALKLADHLATENPAAMLGARGGSATAKRGPEYFKQIAAMRTNRKGGRPKKHLPGH